MQITRRQKEEKARASEAIEKYLSLQKMFPHMRPTPLMQKVAYKMGMTTQGIYHILIKHGIYTPIKRNNNN